MCTYYKYIKQHFYFLYPDMCEMCQLKKIRVYQYSVNNEMIK